MVHKKSEYALNYKIMQKDLNERKQIWQDNIIRRDFHRSLNRADHYWSFQLSGNCSCDDDADDEILDTTVPHRIKHKALLAKYSSNQSSTLDGLLWSNNEKSMTKKRQPDTERSEMKSTVVEPALLSREEIGVQTPNWYSTDFVDDSRQEIKELDRGMNLNTVPDKVTPLRQRSPTPPPLENTAGMERPLTVADLIPDYIIQEPNRSRSLRTSQLVRSPGSGTSRNTLTRTSRKSFFSEKVTPFASYGWNNKVDSMGTKKTYNVSAPEGEVDGHAVLTQRRRHEDVERFLREESSRKQAMTGVRSRSVVNHSSIWKSEYQDRYTPERLIMCNSGGKSIRARSVSAVRPASNVQWYRGNG